MSIRDDEPTRRECRSIIAASADYLDCLYTEARSREIKRHLESCSACQTHIEEMVHLRRSVRALPKRQVPTHLAISLRITASKVVARRVSRIRWDDRFKLWSSNVWRPFALPMAGGLASACILFSAMMPSFARPAAQMHDAPPQWYQSAELSDLGPFGVHTDELMLDIRLDQQGRMIDYSIPASETVLLRDVQLRRNIENNLLFMRFKPAAFFGQPTMGKLRITIRRSQVDVKG